MVTIVGKKDSWKYAINILVLGAIIISEECSNYTQELVSGGGGNNVLLGLLLDEWNLQLMYRGRV